MKGEKLIRLRKAASSTQQIVKYYSTGSPRAYHTQPVPSTFPSAPPWFLPFDTSYPTGPSSKSHAHASGSSNPILHAVSPYSDLLGTAHSLPHDTISPSIASIQSFASSSLYSNSPAPFLPFYSSPSSSTSQPTTSNSRLGTSPRRSDNKSASLCFRKNGASGIPKRKTIDTRMGPRSQPDLPGFSRPDPLIDLRSLKSVQVGEDAYFIRNDSLGVADGVGGWSGKKGADPAMFSRLLMHYCASGLERYEDVDDPLFLDFYNVDPVDVLSDASILCIEEAKQKGIAGSSTALVAILRRDVLRVANLGDCSCAVIRGTEYLFRSEEQQHSFNYPMQVGTQSRDTPKKDAQRFDIKVQKDDIVILSSDGLIDNLFEEDILEEVLRFSHPTYDPTSPLHTSQTADLGKQAIFSPQAVSEALCSRAKAVIEDPLAVNSPFQQKASEEGMYYTGGKPDDITVLVAVIGEETDSEDRR